MDGEIPWHPFVVGASASTRHAISRFLADAARWVEPEEIADRSELTVPVVLKLLLRHPSLRAMFWFRVGSLAKALGVRGVPSWTQRRMLRLYGLELVPGSEIGGGLYIAHPVGCVLVAESIGENVSVIGQVTFGVRNDYSQRPRIRDGVFVGAGARLLGGIELGEGSSVGANAVVVHDVAPGETVVGIPARPVKNSNGRSTAAPV